MTSHNAWYPLSNMVDKWGLVLQNINHSYHFWYIKNVLIYFLEIMIVLWYFECIKLSKLKSSLLRMNFWLHTQFWLLISRHTPLEQQIHKVFICHTALLCTARDTHSYLACSSCLYSERHSVVICHSTLTYTVRDPPLLFVMQHSLIQREIHKVLIFSLFTLILARHTVLVAREIYIVLIYSHGCFCHGTHLHVSNERYTQLFFVSQLMLLAHIYWSFTLTRNVQFWLPLSSHMLHSSMMISKYHDNMKISRYHDDIKISGWYQYQENIMISKCQDQY